MSDTKIENVMPWGRSMEEYIHMFALSQADLDSRILSCADGPASFNAEMTERGKSVKSVDPIYAFSPDEIRQRIDDTKEIILKNTKAHLDKYRWDTIIDLEELERTRMAAMNTFLEFFETGKHQKRYIPGALPNLDFPDQTFDLVLCSHCLFTYTEQLDLDFHIASILEMLRVGKEVRIFPLLDMNGETSTHLEPTIAALKNADYGATKTIVNYEFQIGGNTQLRVRSGSNLGKWVNTLVTNDLKK